MNVIRQLLFFLIVVVLAGCSAAESEVKLTAIQVQNVQEDGTYSGEEIIVEADVLQAFEEAFEQVEWEDNVKAEMARREDGKILLFYEESERIDSYFIWFEDNGKATLLDTVKHRKGTLDKEGTLLLTGK